MIRTYLLIPLVILISACSNKETPLASLPDLSARCAPTSPSLVCMKPIICRRLIRRPRRSFAYGRHLQKQKGPKDFNEVARFYRIAAAHGHYKANGNLQKLVSQGLAKSPHPAKETVDLAAQLIKAGVPGGYYDMGHYLELGYGVKRGQ